MAVQAHHQYLAAHAFPHDSRAIRPELDTASALLGGGRLPTTAAAMGGNAAAFGDLLTCNINNGDGGCFSPRKRARVGGLVNMEAGHGGALLPPLPPPPQQQRVLCSATASTSGRLPTALPSRGLLSLLYRHSVETDALVSVENERFRAGLDALRRRHLRAVLSVAERAAARRLRGAEAELERALLRNAELEERLRQTSAEGQAWQGVARSHEAVAAGLRAALEQVLQPPPPPCAATTSDAGAAEDAQSCCGFEKEEGAEDGGATSRRRACRACGEAGACVLLLPCRHLCLCAGCEAAVDACPVCAATKNASLHVLLS